MSFFIYLTLFSLRFVLLARYSSCSTLCTKFSCPFGASSHTAKFSAFLTRHYLPYLGPAPSWYTKPCHIACAKLIHYASFCLCVFTDIPSMTTSGHLTYLTSLSLQFASIDNMTFILINQLAPTTTDILTSFPVSFCAIAYVTSAMTESNYRHI